MALLVLLGNAEVDVEEQEVAVRRGLGRVACEQLPQPGGVHEFVVVRKALDRERLVGGPLRPARVVHADALLAQFDESRSHRPDLFGEVAVQHDLARVGDVLDPEQPLNLGGVDAIQPRAREGDRARDVAASCGARQVPAVVGGERTDVDDRQSGVVQAKAKLVRRDAPLRVDVDQP